MVDFEGPFGAFWRELRERRVIRAALVYAVAAWVAVQVADTFFPALRLPDWSVTLVAALAILGFPAAVILAWVFEVSREGVRREEPLTTPRLRPWRYGLAGAALFGIGAVGVGFLLLDREPAPRSGGGGDLPASIAVLPFTDMSAAGNQAHLGDGITEDILTRLAQVSGLRVTSRTSVMRYRDTEKGIREIGRELGVGAILEGSVRSEGGRVRITAQLIDAGSDEHLWAESYDRSAIDIFSIQREIAEEIVSSLRLTLSPEEEAGLRAPGTDSPEAYDLYLRARERLYRPYASTEQLRRRAEAALVLFEEALRADPDFAPAHAGMARAYLDLPGPDTVWADTVAALARRAVRLAPRLASGYVALGLAYLVEGPGNRDAARDQFLLALELNPNEPDALTLLGDLARAEGRLVGALERYRRAADVDPQDPVRHLNLAQTYLDLHMLERAATAFRTALEGVVRHPARLQCHLAEVDLLAGRPESARERARRMLELEDEAFAHNCAASIYVEVGDLERAIEHRRRSAELDVGDPEAEEDARRNIVGLRALMGDSTGLGAWLEAEETEAREVLGRGSVSHSPHFRLARVVAFRGDAGAAATHLDEAFRRGYRDYDLLLRRPLWAAVRDEPPVREVLDRIRRDVEGQRAEALARGL